MVKVVVREVVSVVVSKDERSDGSLGDVGGEAALPATCLLRLTAGFLYRWDSTGFSFTLTAWLGVSEGPEPRRVLWPPLIASPMPPSCSNRCFKTTSF